MASADFKNEIIPPLQQQLYVYLDNKTPSKLISFGEHLHHNSHKKKNHKKCAWYKLMRQWLPILSLLD